MRKIFINHLSDKGLISKIHKELIQLENKITSNSIKNRPRNSIDIFPKEDIRMADRYMKRCSTSVVVREM